MENKIRVKFIADPQDARFIEGTHVSLDIKQAYDFYKRGIAIGYKRGSRQEYDPFLSEEYPSRDLLAENGIYTKQQLEQRLDDIEEIDGIGSKTAQKYHELLFPETDEEIDDEMQEVLDDLDKVFEEE